MSRGPGMFLNFFHHIHNRATEEERVYNYFGFELPSPGKSSLHHLCQLGSSAPLRKFLETYEGPVDLVDPESGVTPLVTACKKGVLESVALLVDRGANVNHRCSGVTKRHVIYDKITPIHVAAAAGHVSIVEYLGNQGADVNVKMSPPGLTPVHLAIYLKRRNVVSVLIEQFKAKVSLPCVNDVSSYPVHNAVSGDDYHILETVLSAADANPNVPDTSEHITALHLAAYKGDLVAAEILISHGANVDVQLKCGHSPLDLAIQEKARHVAEFLEQRGGQRKVLDKSWHPFFYCAFNGLQSLKMAVNRGVDINSLLTPTGGTALHMCVFRKKMDACKFLIRKGADLERRCVYGNTPLHVATELGLNNFIEFLLEKGANINAQNDHGYAPLHKAALMGYFATCKLLISKGADLDVMSRELGPPIIGAIHKRDTNIVKLLLKAGANPNAKSVAWPNAIDQVTVLQTAVQLIPNKPEIIKALIEAGADVRAPIISHATVSYLHILPMVTDNVISLKLLIEAGAYLDSQAILTNPGPQTSSCLRVNGDLGRDRCMPLTYSGTPLQSVKKEGSPALVRLLKNTISLFKAVRRNDMALAEKYHAQGGLVNCCSIRYDTPLIYASWKGFAHMVKFLLSNGARIDMPNLQNSSPLHYAARYNQKEVAIELLKAGAPINLVRANKTPLELAQEHNQSDAVAILEFAKNYLMEYRTDKISPIADWKENPKITRLASEFHGRISEEDLEALFGLRVPLPQVLTLYHVRTCSFYW